MELYSEMMLVLDFLLLLWGYVYLIHEISNILV